MISSMTTYSRAVSKVILVLAIAVLVLIAAGAYFAMQPTTTTLSGTLNVAAFSGYNDAALQKIANDFQAKYPNVTVNVLGIPYGQSITKYLSVFQANLTTYDIVSMGSVGFMGSLNPYLMDLKSYLSDAKYFPSSYNMSDVIPSLMPLYSYKDKQLGLPEAGGAMLFYYRPSFFNNATIQQLFQQQLGYPLQVPTTLKQLTDIAKFATGNQLSKYGVTLMSGSDDDDAIQTYLALMAGLRNDASSQYGPVTAPYGVLMDSAGHLLLNSSIGIQALTTYTELVRNSESPGSASYSTTPVYFANGDAPMMIYWNPPVFWLNNATRSKVVGDYMVAPRMPGGYSVLGGTGLSIVGNTPNRDLALRFLAFATSPEESIYFNTINSLMPFRYSVFTTVIAANPALSQQLNNLVSTMTYSVEGSANIPNWPQISTVFRTTIPQVIQNQKSVQDAVNEMMSQIGQFTP
jgi:ABC-type glycerol-3-phosphate transport system substrate-binding protein